MYLEKGTILLHGVVHPHDNRGMTGQTDEWGTNIWRGKTQRSIAQSIYISEKISSEPDMTITLKMPAGGMDRE